MPDPDSSLSPLMKAATPDLYRRNAFRLTGLPVTATAREVSRQADKLKMLAEVGGHAAQQLTVLPGAEPPTLDEVREAVQKLKELEARAVDEFFWFWPEDWEKPDQDEAFAALKRNDLDAAFNIWTRREVQTEDESGAVIASHNLAVMFHMRALEWTHVDLQHPLSKEEAVHEVKYWKRAFERWEWLASDDRLWNTFKARIRQIDDAALTTGFARRLRAELPHALDQINASLALAYAEQGRQEETEWHVIFLKSTHAEDDDSDGTIDQVLSPTRARLERHLEVAWKSLKENKAQGLAHAQALLKSVPSWHRILVLMLGEDHEDAKTAGNDIAEAVLSCAIAGVNAAMETASTAPPLLPYQPNQKALATKTFIDVLISALTFACDVELRARIKDNIQAASSNQQFDAQVKPLLDALVAIKGAVAKADAKLARIQAEILPKVDSLISARNLDVEILNELCDSVAIVLRDLGIEAHNVHSQHVNARIAITKAEQYARDPKLKAQLAQDRGTLYANLMAVSPKKPTDDGSTVGYLILIAVVAVIWAVSQIGLFSSDGVSAESPKQRKATPLKPLYTPPAQSYVPPRIEIPKQPLPATGVYRSPGYATNTGPLTIRTRYGSGNFYAKLVDPSTGYTRMAIFIRNGEIASDMDVPAGTYELRYASGDSWYGETELFGSSTSYSKAESLFTFGNGSGYTVELYKQVNGNLHTNSIDKDDF